MGLIRFEIYPEANLNEWPEVYRGYMTGADGRIFPSRIEVDGRVIGCRRMTSESGRFHVVWPVNGHGRLLLSTTSLPERPAPYLLAVELARGKIVQIRDQSAQWEGQGMQLSPAFRLALGDAQSCFRSAALNQDRIPQAVESARQAIVRACDAAAVLAADYADQAAAARRTRSAGTPKLLGVDLGSARPEGHWERWLPGPLNAAGIRLSWKDIEPEQGNYRWEAADDQLVWCEAHRLLIRGGPVIDFGGGGLPAWLSSWENKTFDLQCFMADFIETAMTRYMGRIRHWEIAARPNTGGALALSEEQRLTLLARVLEVARQVDEESQLSIRIDQPWGEYQARGQHRLSPLQLVDALVRSGVGLNSVNLEVAVGYHPRGSAHRDPLEFSRLIDAWSVLGVPLNVTLSSPAADGFDAKVTTDLEPDPRCWEQGASERQQERWLSRILPVLMAKPAVVGVYWNHLTDAAAHEYPHAGLWNTTNVPRQVWNVFSQTP